MSSQSGTGAGMGSASSGMAGITATARRLNQVVRHGLSVVNSRGFSSTSVGRELSNIFSFLSQPANNVRYLATGARRTHIGAARRWKTTPCLLNSPSMTRVPTREQMGHLCRNIKYELCHAGGPSHHMIVPLAIDDEEMVPSLERHFQPYFGVNVLKERIGRKECLYIRPLTPIDVNALPTVSTKHVSLLS